MPDRNKTHPPSNNTLILQYLTRLSLEIWSLLSYVCCSAFWERKDGALRIYNRTNINKAQQPTLHTTRLHTIQQETTESWPEARWQIKWTPIGDVRRPVSSKLAADVPWKCAGCDVISFYCVCTLNGLCILSPTWMFKCWLPDINFFALQTLWLVGFQSY